MTVSLVVLLPVAALAGLATAFSPCVLPVLPLVLGASAGGGRWRPLGVVTGLVLGFAMLVLLGATLVTAVGLPPMALRLLAAIIIAGGGLVLVVPPLNDALTVALERLAARLRTGLAPRRLAVVGGTPGDHRGPEGGYGTGLLLGLGVGLAWTPCAGPVLAAVVALAATQGPTPAAAALTLAYALGHAVPLLAIAYGGRRLGVTWARTRLAAPALRRAFGVVLVGAAALVATGLDQGAQSGLARLSTTGVGAWLGQVEQAPPVQRRLDQVLGAGGSAAAAEGAPAVPASAPPAAADGLPSPPLRMLGTAPEFAGITAWFNGPPLRLAELRGRVVLIDFWTYTCINCLRTLPYLKAWDTRYRDAGLTIVGVHTPEFAFEGVPANVQAAVVREGIRYPVALDRDYATWRAYRNRFWPSKYLIDAAGQLRYVHFGEGAYAETEAAIRALLAEAGHAPPALDGERVEAEQASTSTTAETYLGFERLEPQQFASPQPVARGFAQLYTAPPWPAVPLHAVALDGRWTVREEAAESGPDSALLVRFYANTVNLVMAPPPAGDAPHSVLAAPPVRVRVWLDGQPIEAVQAGADVVDGVVLVDVPRLYRLVDLRARPDAHTLRLAFEVAGVRAFAFTFG